jgi:hypothetical protein
MHAAEAQQKVREPGNRRSIEPRDDRAFDANAVSTAHTVKTKPTQRRSPRT